MCYIRLHTRFLLLFTLLASFSASAQYFADQESKAAATKALEVSYEKYSAAIDTLRTYGNYPLLDHLTDRGGDPRPPRAKVDENSPAVQAVRTAFNRTQKFLFGDKTPFELILCESCDLQPQFIKRQVIYVDIHFIERLLEQMDPNLVNLDIAHAFSHYLIELYIAAIAPNSPAGAFSRFVDPNWFFPPEKQKKYTFEELVDRDAKYHSEVEAFASGILLKMGLEIPDYSVVIELYRAERFKNNRRHPFAPYDIYVSQEMRLNTFSWIREHWVQPQVLPSRPLQYSITH